jgi:hypothetical protein
LATRKFSDFTDRELDVEPVLVVVHGHPDAPDRLPVLEAVPDEVTPLIDAAMTVVMLDLYFPGEPEPRIVVVDCDDFDARFGEGVDRAKAFRRAPSAEDPKLGLTKGRRSSSRASGGVDYATLEHAGTPHRGRITEAEARIVREHLSEVNARLARDGRRQIDPNDPADAERYGFVVAVAGVGSGTSGGATDLP